jgi:hypothetical protein
MPADEFPQFKGDSGGLADPTGRSSVTPLRHAHSGELAGSEPQLQAAPMAGTSPAAAHAGLSSVGFGL